MHPLAPFWFAIGFAACHACDFVLSIVYGRPAKLQIGVALVGAVCFGFVAGKW